MASRSEHTGPACTAHRSFLSRWLCSLLQCRRQCFESLSCLSWQWDCQIKPEVIDCLLLPLLNRCPVQGQTVTRQTCSVTAVPVSRILTRCVGMGCSCADSGALMLSVKLGPQLSSSVSYLHAGHRSDHWLQPQTSFLSARMNASCAASSAACVSLMIHSDSDWMTDNIPSIPVHSS